MSINTNFTQRTAMRLIITTIAALVILAGCGSDKPKKDDKKDDRSPQERVVLLKQRFDQLESSLHEMKQDVEIQKKRIESTQKIVDSIKHSLIKGGLKGYSLGNVSTTDPLVLAAMSKQQAEKQDKEAREAEKEKADNTLLDGLLIACFVIFIIAIFVAALKDKKTVEPVETTVWPDTTEPDQTEPSMPEPEDETADNRPDEYGVLRPPSHHPESGNSESIEKPEDRHQ